MDNKKSFILYLDQKELFDSLPDEIAGKLIKHIFSYVNCEDPVSDDLIITVAFASIKQSLKRDLKKWESSITQRSEAGKISAARRAEKKAKEAPTNSTSVESRLTETNELPTNPTVSVSDSVSGSVSVSVSDSVSKKTNTCQPPGMTLIKNNDVQDVFDYWIKVMGKNALTSKLTTKRKKAINDRLKDKYTVTMIFRAIEGCFDDPFSMGVNERNKPFNDIELICRTGEKLESFYNTSLGNNRQVVVKEFF
tara:strand:+ start:586 stop:1338 length:753 start_codon:yes stop_codon:yes gene_type:complete